MFNGYLLKIDGVQFPNLLIIESSYSVDRSPLVVNDYYDGNYDRHVEFAEKDNVVVSFDTRVMSEADYRAISGMFHDEMEVNYYDPLTGLYDTGVFTYTKNLTPTIRRIANDNTIFFKEQSIELIRKRGR